MKILNNIYDEIIACPSVPPETGGIIGIQKDVVCKYVFDRGYVKDNAAIYTPNICVLNKCIEQWYKNDIIFGGIVHSHLPFQESLSLDDIEYINTVMKSLPESIHQLYFPIVIPNEKIISYKALRKNGIVIIQDDIIKIIY